MRLRITLRDVKPTVWRRLEVSLTATLADLHAAIQAAMGWEDLHLHCSASSADAMIPSTAFAKMFALPTSGSEPASGSCMSTITPRPGSTSCGSR